MLGPVLSYSGHARRGAAQEVFAEKRMVRFPDGHRRRDGGTAMRSRGKGFKEVNVCLSYLQELQTGGVLDPRQKEKLDRAVRLLKTVQHLDPQGGRRILAAVKGITEVLWEAFSRTKQQPRVE